MCPILRPRVTGATLDGALEVLSKFLESFLHSGHKLELSGGEQATAFCVKFLSPTMITAVKVETAEWNLENTKKKRNEKKNT